MSNPEKMLDTHPGVPLDPLDHRRRVSLKTPVKLSSTNYSHQATYSPPHTMLKKREWWLKVSLNIIFLLAGETTAILLGRFYYNQGGHSKWMLTLVQSAGAPLLLFPHHLFSSPSTPIRPTPSLTSITFIYISLGLMMACDDLMYSYGLSYLSVSTFSLICATQLAFNAIFSYFLNSQKFTDLILNSVVLLSFSAALLGVSSNSEYSNESQQNYPLGFALTMGASATFSLSLSLMQLTFQKVQKRETFAVVLEMQIYSNTVAACVSVVGLFASGEWRSLKGEMEVYDSGRVSYVMTLVWIAISWQVASVATVGLIFVASSLFSNVISTLSLPVVPIFAVIFFHDKLDAVKVVAMLIAFWGFVSYLYEHYLDDSQDQEGC